MAIIKLIDHHYCLESDVVNLMYYISNPLRNNTGICGGHNIIGSAAIDPDSVAEQFICIENLHHFSRRLYHIVIALDPVLDQPDPIFISRIGQAVCGLYPQFQSVFALHDNTDYLHLHVIWNNCAIFPDTKNLSYSFNIVRIAELVDRLIDRRIGLPALQF